MLLAEIERLPTKQGGLTVNHKHITPLGWVDLQPPAFSSDLLVIMMTLRPISVYLRFIHQVLDCGLEWGWSWHLSIHQFPKFCCEALKPAWVCPALTASRQRYCSPRSSRKFNYASIGSRAACYNTNLQSQRDALSLWKLWKCVITTWFPLHWKLADFLGAFCKVEKNQLTTRPTLDKQSNYWTAAGGTSSCIYQQEWIY